MGQQDDKENEWHLDKKVPLALIATIGISMFGNVWWLSALGSRVDFIERAISNNALVREDIVKITEQLRSLDRVVGRIEERWRGHRIGAFFPGE